MKKKIVLALLLVAVVLTAVLGAAACTKTELIGFDVELAQAVGKDLGVEVEFQLINWNNKENELESKNVDLLWNGMTITEEREAQMEISEPYMLNEQVAIIRKADASKFDTLDKMLASKKWTAESGSAGAELIPELGATLIGVSSQINILTELNAGSADIGVMDSVMAGYYINETGSEYADSLMIAPVKIALEDEYYGIAARKGEVALMDKINTSLAKLYADGTVGKIAETYGLTDVILPVEYTSQWDSIADKSSWDYIVNRGKIVIGYTLFAPIAYEVVAE